MIPVTKRMSSDSRFAPVNRFLNCNDTRLGKKIPLETYRNETIMNQLKSLSLTY